MKNLSKVVRVTGSQLKDIDFPYGFCINFLRRKLYRKELTIAQILVYEYLLQFSNSIRRSTFKVSQNKIMSDTGLTKGMVSASVNKLVEWGAISIELEKTKNIKKGYVYAVNRDFIAENLEVIYSLEGLKPHEIKDHKESLKQFLKLKYKVYKKKTSKTFNVKETETEKDEREESTEYSIHIEDYIVEEEKKTSEKSAERFQAASMPAKPKSETD